MVVLITIEASAQQKMLNVFSAVKMEIMQGSVAQLKSKSSATLSAPVLSCITASSPNCLQASVVSATVNGVNVQALMDTGSSESYIDRNLYEKLS